MIGCGPCWGFLSLGSLILLSCLLILAPRHYRYSFVVTIFCEARMPLEDLGETWARSIHGVWVHAGKSVLSDYLPKAAGYHPCPGHLRIEV